MPAKSPPTAKPKARKRPAARAAKPAPVVASQPATAPAAPTTLEEIESMLVAVRLRLREEGLSATAHAKLSAEIRNYLKLKASIQRDDAVSEDKISHHPTWLKLRDEIIEVVATCERCAPALSEKL